MDVDDEVTTTPLPADVAYEVVPVALIVELPVICVKLDGVPSVLNLEYIPTPGGNVIPNEQDTIHVPADTVNVIPLVVTELPDDVSEDQPVIIHSAAGALYTLLEFDPKT